jgi:hypothetical protein
MMGAFFLKLVTESVCLREILVVSRFDLGIKHSKNEKLLQIEGLAKP